MSGLCRCAGAANWLLESIFVYILSGVCAVVYVLQSTIFYVP